MMVQALLLLPRLVVTPPARLVVVPPHRAAARQFSAPGVRLGEDGGKTARGAEQLQAAISNVQARGASVQMCSVSSRSEALFDGENETDFKESLIYKKGDSEAAGVKDPKVAKVFQVENTRGDASGLIGGRGGGGEEDNLRPEEDPEDGPAPVPIIWGKRSQSTDVALIGITIASFALTVYLTVCLTEYKDTLITQKKLDKALKPIRWRQDIMLLMLFYRFVV